MKVMVTGARGFLGMYAVEALEAAGHESFPYDMKEGDDVRDAARVWAKAKYADAVIHLAGALGTEELFAAPKTAVDVNVTGTVNVLKACGDHGLKYVGITMPSVWANVYQATKRCAADMALAWHENYGVPVSFVRAYNAYGIGQKVHGVQKIIPTFATKAWRNEPIPVWGDGNQVVDLVWAGDIGRMLVDALRFGDGQTFDAGTGDAWTVNGVVEMTLEATGSESMVKYLPMRMGERKAYPIAAGEGWGRLNWQPPFRHDKFAETIEWYKEERP